MSYFLFCFCEDVLFLDMGDTWWAANPNTQRRTCAAILYALSSHCLQGEVLNSISLFLSFHSFTLDFMCIACFTLIQTLRTMLHLSLGVQEDFLFLFLCLVSENVGFFTATKFYFLLLFWKFGPRCVLHFFMMNPTT